MRRVPSLLVNLALGLLALGAVGWSVLLVRGSGPVDTASSAVARTVTVAQGTVTATVTAGGTVEAASTASAAFGTPGTVTAVDVKVGQRVTAGQLLARVDPATAQRALALARANLDAADDALGRATDAGGDTTAAANAVTAARLAVGDARAAVDGTRLTAPMNGTVIAVNGTVGASAAGGTTATGTTAAGTTATGTAGNAATGFVEIANLGDLQVTAGFGEADATQLRPGQDAAITWSALTGAAATGKVLAVDPSATTSDSVVSYGVSIGIGTLPAGARPGQTVSVTVTTGTAANATYVNSAAVTVSGGRHTATVRKDDGTTETRTVEVGLAGDDSYQIISGLAVGEQVVLPESSGSGSSGTVDQRSGGVRFGGNGGPP